MRRYNRHTHTPTHTRRRTKIPIGHRQTYTHTDVQRDRLVIDTCENVSGNFNIRTTEEKYQGKPLPAKSLNQFYDKI